MKAITATALSLVTLATPLVAQDSSGLTFSGDIRIEHSIVGSDNDTFLIGSGDLNFDFGNGFGIVAAAEAYASDTYDLEALWLAASYSGDWGSVQFGAPESVIDTYTSTGEFNGSAGTYHMPMTMILRQSYVKSVALLEDETPLGLRFDGSSGNLSYGVSYHSFDDGALTSVAGAFRYDIYAYGVFGGVERNEMGGGDLTLWRVGADADMGSHGGSAVVSGGNDGFPTTIELQGFYRPTDQITLGLAVMDIDSSETLYGVNAEYAFANNAYVRGSVTRADGFSDTMVDLSVGFRF